MFRPKSSRLHMSTLRQNQQSFSASLAEMRKDMDQRLKSSGFKVSRIEVELYIRFTFELLSPKQIQVHRKLAHLQQV